MALQRPIALLTALRPGPVLTALRLGSISTALRPWFGVAAVVLGAALILASAGSMTQSQAQQDKSPPDKKEKGSKDEGFAPSDDKKDDADNADAEKGKSKAKDEDEPKSTNDQNREALPHGVVVPPQRPPEFSLNDPKTTEEEWKSWSKGKARGEFDSKVQSGSHDSQSDKIVADGIRMQLAAMTLPSMRDPKADRFPISEIVQKLLRSVKSAALKLAGGDQRQYRIFMMQEIIKDCRELNLASNQYYVRLNAAVLLGNLFIEEYNATTKAAPEFYTPAFDALMEILEKDGQSEGVKLTALDGLRNACLYGNPPLQVSENVRLAKRLIAELEKPASHEWYQERLCDTLSLIDQVRDLNGQPIIVQALSKVLFDTGRPLCARAAAAKALGRTPLDPSIDLNVIAYGIADLSRQLVESRNDGKKHVARRCIADVLLAFVPMNSNEKSQSRRVGLLDRVEEASFVKYRNSVKQAWNAVRPMIVEELRHRGESDVEFPAEVLPPIVEWLKTNTPADMRISPGMPPVTTTQVTKVDSNGRK